MIYNYVYLKFIEKIKQFDLTENFSKTVKYDKYEVEFLILNCCAIYGLVSPVFYCVLWRKKDFRIMPKWDMTLLSKQSKT
jgi:hypothetical protein